MIGATVVPLAAIVVDDEQEADGSTDADAAAPVGLDSAVPTTVDGLGLALRPGNAEPWADVGPHAASIALPIKTTPTRGNEITAPIP